jgi:hypothetical protein
MTDAPPPLVLGPELLAHMREHPNSELTKLARAYIKLALMFTGENDLSNCGPGEGRGLRLSPSEMAELTRELESINEKLERR